MYPKSLTAVSERKQAKREQLADLLISKFRAKHQINSVTERELDTQVRLEVTRFIQPGSASDINDLDKTITTTV